MNFSDHGVIVPDISFYQDDDTTPRKVDFQKMKAAGAVGVILRAGQNTWQDEDFADYKRDAVAAGLPWGSYWFYDSRNDPGRQALLWRAAIGADVPQLGLWDDFEESYNGAYKGERYWKQFSLAVDSFFPSVKRGIYTANWWWSAQTIGDPSFWAARPLWVAQYIASPADVALPRPWLSVGCKLWQYTAHGNGPDYGAESANIDLNKWNGSLESFRSYFGLSDTVSEPPTEAPMQQAVIKNTTSLRIRTGPGATYAQIGGLYAGDVAYGESDPSGWFHISSIKRANGTTQVINGWASAAYLTITAVQPAPVTVPFSLSIDGFKPYSGELEKA